ncbi:lipid-A-disaccharide synthase [Telmatobacter bradus]|uniref:lipid-A-disaccharide synthase n=1 Tax=Telmatobacter bradus TaxID=474953 RepID=UPI003B42FD93
MSPTIFISAGEASGEHYGALLTAELDRKLRAAGQEPRFFGMGGERMAAAGLERVVRAEDVAVMGLTEVVRHLPRIYGEFRKLKRSIRERRPSLAILIDLPDIHLRLAREFHRLGIPVLYFVSPQLWAWKKHRIKQVQQFVRRMAVIFPFEEQFYREHGVKADFVGHPLADLPLPTISREQFAAENGLHPGRTWVALLPGSRPHEIRDHLPELIEAAWRLAQPKENLTDSPTEAFEFMIPLAPTLTVQQQEAVLMLTEKLAGALPVRLVDDARAALFHARASVVASGTATVEAALIGNPFVVVYRVSPLTFAIAKRLVTVEHVAMANLIAGHRMVPELIQQDFSAEKIVQEMERLLPDGPDRQSMLEELAEMGRVLRTAKKSEEREGSGSSAIERVACIALEELGVQSAVNESPPTV